MVSYVAGDLAEWLVDHRIDHVRGAPLHPQTQGKIERWHQTRKNRILLDNYYLRGDLEAYIGSSDAFRSLPHSYVEHIGLAPVSTIGNTARRHFSQGLEEEFGNDAYLGSGSPLT